MTTPTQIRDAIKTVIETVANVGTVHTYQRTVSWAGDLWESGLFVYTADDPDTIRGWQISLDATRQDSDDTGQWTITHAWSLAVIWQVDDGAANEETLDDTIDLVREAFRTNDTLGSVVATLVVDGVAGTQLVEKDLVSFGDVLCHAARLDLSTRHYI